MNGGNIWAEGWREGESERAREREREEPCVPFVKPSVVETVIVFISRVEAGKENRRGEEEMIVLRFRQGIYPRVSVHMTKD